MNSPIAGPTDTVTAAMASNPTGNNAPGDVGFGYIHSPAPIATQVVDAKSPGLGPKSALKSALRNPNEPRRTDAVLSPTFKDDEVLREKIDIMVDKAQEQDLVRSIVSSI